MIVLDASAAIAVLLNFGASSQDIGSRMQEADGGVYVPHIFEVEVLSALRHHSMRGLSSGRGAGLIEDLTSMRLTRYPHTALLERMWELRDNLTAYDAAYVALAETLNASLLTMDARLSRAPGIRARVEVYGQ